MTYTFAAYSNQRRVRAKKTVDQEIRTPNIEYLPVQQLTDSVDYSVGREVEYITGDFDTLISVSMERNAELLERLAKL